MVSRTQQDTDKVCCVIPVNQNSTQPGSTRFVCQTGQVFAFIFPHQKTMAVIFLEKKFSSLAANDLLS